MLKHYSGKYVNLKVLISPFCERKDTFMNMALPVFKHKTGNINPSETDTDITEKQTQTLQTNSAHAHTQWTHNCKNS